MKKLLSQKKIQRIKDLSLKGLSQREVAKKVGCSRSAVFYHLNK